VADGARKALEEFAKLLAQTDDPAQRARLTKRAEMLAMNQVPEEKFEPPIRNLGVYLDTPIDIPPSLVWPTIVVRGEVTATLGRAGKGKTTVNLNRIMKWACGRPLFDGFTCPHDGEDQGKTYIAPSGPLRTLVLENEGSAGMFHQKIGIMLLNNDIFSDEERDLIRENVLIWGDGGYSGLKLDNEQGVANLRAGIEKWEPDIVFIEPFRALWRGEENSSTEMAVVIDNIIGMATDYNCGYILSHHERKSGADGDELMSAGRGSTVLEGAVAVMENFQSVKGGDFRELTWSKARYLQPPPPVRLQYERNNGWYEYVPESDLERAVLEALEINDEPLTKAGLVDILDEKPYQVNKALKQLLEDSRISQLGAASGSSGWRYAIAGKEESDNGLDF
jgi:hypothetical protein